MNNLSLYQITNTFPIIMENEEMTDELKQELTIDAMKTEEKRISEQRKALENRLTKFKEYVKECMEQCGATKIETSLGTLAVAKNPISVEIVNEDEIPSEYKQEVVTTKVDKKAISDNFKATGEIIAGVKINTQNTSLRIK